MNKSFDDLLTKLKGIQRKKVAVAVAVEEASLAFWIAMFDYELKDREFESGIISVAAVLGLEVKRGG